MRLTCCLAVVASTLAGPPFTPFAADAHAQPPIRVARHSPPDTVRAGDAITISFDRPVTSSLDRAPDPTRLVRIEPRVAARVEWRDPVTLRVIPASPLPPSRRYTITVDTFSAEDGGRLAEPYRFTLQARGPRLLARLPAIGSSVAPLFDPRGMVTLVYSAPVDTAALSRIVRFETGSTQMCAARTIRFRVKATRGVLPTEEYAVQAANTSGMDVDRRFRTAVLLQSESPLPDGCVGDWVVPSFDPNDRLEIRSRAATMLPFQILSVACTGDDCAVTPAFRLSFNAPVDTGMLARSLRIEPKTAFTLESMHANRTDWLIRLSVKGGTTYHIALDSVLTDTYGRRLRGLREHTIAVSNRRPALGHQLGFFTLSRQHPMLRLTHLNVDSVDVAIIPIPDSLRYTVVANQMDPGGVARIIAQLRDTIHQVVALARPPNAERFTDIPLPGTLLDRYPGALFAIRARAIWDPTIVGGPLEARPGQLPTVQVVGEPDPLSNYIAIVQVTDLVAHVKIDGAWGAAFVTDMNDGRPVAGATVTLRDPRSSFAVSGTTDTTGITSFGQQLRRQPAARPSGADPYWYPGASYYRAETRVVEVMRGRDRSMILVSPYNRESQTLDVAYPDASYDRVRFARGMVYTERPIYRPGETVYLGMIVRDGWLGDPTVPRGDSVRVRVMSNESGPVDEDVVRDTTLRLTRFGTAVDSFPLPRAATLGEYMARLDVVIDSAWHTVGWASFRVAEYRAPEFKTTATLDSTVHFLGDTIRGRVTSRYYFGSAMAGAVVNWQAATSAESWVRIPGLPAGFVVGHWQGIDGPARPPSPDPVQGVDTLDGTGAVDIAIPTTPGSLSGPGTLTLSASVEDLNRQFVTAIASTTVHASAYYVAVRDPSKEWYWKQDVPVSLDVIAVRPDGRRVHGVRVAVTAVRHQYVWSRSPDGSAPVAAWLTDTLTRDSVVTADSIVHVRYTPRTSAWHQLLFTVVDDRGRPLTTSVGRYALSPGINVTWGRGLGSLVVRVTPDSAEVGDSARVEFISPFRKAEAWVTIEREGILAQRRLTVRQGMVSVPFAMTDRLVPGATATVTLIDSTAAWQTDSLHHRMRAGRAVLAARPSRRLTVEVLPHNATYAPADSARITVRLRDHRMRPVRGEITLWAVDESVLALEEYQTPDPYTAMYGTRGSGLTFATTAATLAQLGRNLAPSGWRLSIYGRHSIGNATARLSEVVMTGTAAAPPNATLLRTNFRTTAFYLAGLVTDSTGSITASVKLPDNVTTYRLIAVATTEDSRFGSGEGSVMVTKPLLARSALPRFVRTGDSLIAGAVLTNRTASMANVDVRATGHAVKIDGDARVAQRVGPDASAEVRFAWHTSAPPGDSAAFRFDIAGGGNADAVQAALPVRPPYSPRYHTVTGVARGTSTVRMLLPRELDPARSRLTLRVGTTPAPVIRAAFWRLQVYPYQCTEQLTSTGQVILAMLRLQRAGLLDSTIAPTSSELRGKLQMVVDELSHRSTDDGGIGYWGAASWTDRRLTTYAGDLLLSARELGIDVRSRTLAAIVAYLGDATPTDPDTVHGVRAAREAAVAVALAEDLARARYLRLAGAPDVAAEARIVESEARMRWEDRILVAQLAAAHGDSGTARAILTRAWQRVAVAGNRLDVPDSLLTTSWFPSRVRPMARLLSVTMALEPGHVGIPALVESVVQQHRLRGGWWWNTQDYAVASSVLADVATWQRSAEPRGTLVVRSAARRRSGRVLMIDTATAVHDSTISLSGLVERDGDWLALPLRLEGGDRRVYYSLTVEEVPAAAAVKPDARGVIVERWFERFDDGRPATEVREGELVRGRLRVTLPSEREFLAVEALLPAGLEVVDLSLRTSSTLAPLETAGSRAAQRAGDQANASASPYGTWYDGWWSPWEHQEIRDDRVVYFARALERGSYTATFVARATTAGTFVHPPAHAEEMYNPALGGRSDGGTFRVTPR